MSAQRRAATHDLDKAFLRNIIDPKHVIVIWAPKLGRFMRWTWWCPNGEPI